MNTIQKILNLFNEEEQEADLAGCFNTRKSVADKNE